MTAASNITFRPFLGRPAHHFSDVRAGMREMGRVSRDRVLLVDTLNTGEAGEEAERLRDPSHVRNYTEAEWRDILSAADLELAELRLLHAIDFPAWLERTGCEGEAAARVRKLSGGRVVADRLTLHKIAIKAVKRG